MKCPKCDYLGFDTGERCRNCGYDFSLIAAAPAAAARVATAAALTERDLPLRHADTSGLESVTWSEEVDRSLGGANETAGGDATRPSTAPFSRPRRADADLPASRSARAADAALPLFSPGSFENDEPLIKMPAAPRPPLSVRRTPDSAARRATKQPLSADAGAPFGDRGVSTANAAVATRRPSPEHDHVEEEPTLGFGDDVASFRSDERLASLHARLADVGPVRAGGVVRRVLAVLIDHTILLAVDAAVIYFTLRLVSLTWSDWQLLSPLPLVAFLGLIKLAYFAAFTALGGQTIGKMAMRIRVVSEHDRLVDPMRALGRSLAGALSLLTLGAGFLPALLTRERRALHDRLAHTRVVSL